MSGDEKEKIKLMEQEIDLIKQQQKINKDNRKNLKNCKKTVQGTFL